MVSFELRNPNIQDIDKIARALSAETGLSLAMARLLCLRKITTEAEAEAFFNPSISQLEDPYTMLDMEKAVERIKQAIASNEKICIFGDYDADGICATAMLYMYLSYIGANVCYYIPSRHSEGYGMNIEAIDKLYSQNVKLIITVDNGISANNEVAHAKALGLDCIITDHHTSSGEIPDCVAVLCNTRPDNTYKNTSLCGAGIALKLIQAMGGINAAMHFLPFAGLATVADIVELSPENRAIVSIALSIMNSPECPIGVSALAEVARITNKTITERDLGFALAPRLNASGRMDTAEIGVKLLCSTSMEEALDYANTLNDLNEARRAEEAGILKSALDMLSKQDINSMRAIILKSEEWNPGIIGIAASKLCEIYYKPTILFAQQGETLTGSVRSIPEINIYEVLAKHSDMYLHFGGHKKAAGLTMPAERFEEFYDAINSQLKTNFSPNTFIPKKFYDFAADFSEITPAFVNMLERLAPFGEGNPHPVLLTEGCSLHSMRKIGAEANHLSGRLFSNNIELDFVAFEKAHRFSELISYDKLQVLYTPTLNVWNGTTKLQLKVIEFNQSELENPVHYFNKSKSKFYGAFLSTKKYNKIETAAVSENILYQNPLLAITEAFSSSGEGTLVLVNTHAGAIDLYEKLKAAKLIDYDLFFNNLVKRPCNYNAVICAPMLDMVLEWLPYYSNVIIYDTPIDRGFVNTVFSRLNERAKLILPKKADFSIKEYADRAKSIIDHKMMGRIFKEFNSMCANMATHVKNLVENTAAALALNEADCLLALNIFIELKLYVLDKNGYCFMQKRETNEKIKLSDSSLYRAILSAENDELL